MEQINSKKIWPLNNCHSEMPPTISQSIKQSGHPSFVTPCSRMRVGWESVGTSIWLTSGRPVGCSSLCRLCWKRACWDLFCGAWSLRNLKGRCDFPNYMWSMYFDRTWAEMYFCDFNYPPNMTFFVICFLSVLYNLLTHYMYEICRGLFGVETEVEDHILLTSAIHVYIQCMHTGESHTVWSPPA